MAEDLVLESCDLDCETNNRAHRTVDTGCHALVVRRGQSFHITLRFSNREYQEGVDQLALNVHTVHRPAEELGTKTHISLSDALKGAAWSMAMSSNEGGALVLSVFSPPDARIGRYNLTLEASTGNQVTSFQLGEFILLFNPWSPEDSVYLDDEERRTEYVLTQHGIIFQGTVHSNNGAPWNFGQFEDGILDICLQLLDMNPKFQKDPNEDCSRRNDPVYICRVVSAMVNCDDDSGVLFGRWDNLFDDGIHPMSWIGSMDILHRWRKFGCQAVRYGQCSVFAAVACTVLRCLGIPSRVITNYNSARDTTSNLVIEHYLDENGKPQKPQKFMIWNYHCWLESWMARPDLGDNYDGWQAMDSTPQKKSEGVYCCGPAPVSAVKEGDLGIEYDVPFLFVEVNADVVYYVQNGDGTNRKTIYTAHVGKNISTQAIGQDIPEDITHTYKYPEGSKDERRVFAKASKVRPAPRRAAEQEGKPPGVSIKIKVSDEMNKGSDFDVFVVMTNSTEEEKVCCLTFCAQTTSYSGEVGTECGKKELINLSLPAQGEMTETLRILYEMYGSSMTQDNVIKLVAILSDNASQEITMEMRDIYLKNPEVKFQILGEPMQNRKLVAQLTLRNPLAEPLTGCSFTVEGAGLTEGQQVKILDYPVEPGQEVKVRVDLMPQLSGLRKLVVDFESDLLKGVKGHKNVIIAPLPK